MQPQTPDRRNYNRPSRRLAQLKRQELAAYGYIFDAGGRPKGTGEQIHGTVNSYDHYCCRCEACKEAKRLRVREYREKKRAKDAAQKRELARIVANAATYADTHAFDD